MLPSSALWLPTPGAPLPQQLDLKFLTKSLFAQKLPREENYRDYFGRALDMSRIEAALLMAADGIMVDLTDLLREQKAFDPHLEHLGLKRFGKLEAADHTLTPRKMSTGKADQKIADDVCAMVREKIALIRNFRQAVYDLGWGYFDARAALEIDWQWTGGRFPYTPASLDWIHPRRLGFGVNRELSVVESWRRVGNFEAVGVPLSAIPGKFVTATPRRFADYPEREGLGPRSVFWSFFKRFGRRQWNNLLELFALPWRTAEIDPDVKGVAQSYDVDEIAEKLERLGNQSTAAFQPGVRPKIWWPGSDNQGQIFDLNERTIDSQLSRLWLLTDATGKSSNESGGGQGGDQAAMQKAQQDLVFEGDGTGLSERFQQDLVDVIVMLNMGSEYLAYSPLFELRTRAEKDRLLEQKRYSQALIDRVPFPVADYHEATGIRQADPGEIVMMMGAGGTPELMVMGEDGIPRPVAAVAAPEASEDARAPGADEQEEPPAQGDASEAIRGMLGLERHGIEFARQPDLGHGSPDSLVERGLREGVRATAPWCDALVAAVGAADEPTAIFRALEGATGGLALEHLASSMERVLVRGLMLGAIDSAWEAERDAPTELRIAAQAHGAGGAVLFATTGAEPLGHAEPGFVTRPFQEAISFFLGKKVLPRRAFDRLRAEAKRRAFTLAGQARDEVLQTAKDTLATAIAAGANLRGFAKDLAERFDSAGWTRLQPSHVELVFRNAVMGAYAHGADQQQRQPAVLAARPYWQVRGADDARTRPAHRAAHGKVLAATDPFWARSPLPWGHNERCRRRSLSAADLKRLGLTVTSGATLRDLPDHGWDGGAAWT